MSFPMTGGCACGAVQYECSQAPMFTWKCHCRECQRSTGTGAAVNVVFEAKNVTFIKGKPREFESTGTSGRSTFRGFCAACGSPLSARAAMFPQIHGVSAASLDDPSLATMAAHIWTASAQPWDELSAVLPHFDVTPSETELGELVSTA